jgi:hypothetical protein
MDVLVRCVEPNVTLSTKYEKDVLDKGFSGHLEKGYLSDPHFDDASVMWFPEPAVGRLYHGDCYPKSQNVMFNAWFAPLRKSVWLCLMITILLLSLTLMAQLRFGKMYSTDNNTKGYVASFITFAGLYLRQQGSKIAVQGLVVLSSFCI